MSRGSSMRMKNFLRSSTQRYGSYCNRSKYLHHTNSYRHSNKDRYTHLHRQPNYLLSPYPRLKLRHEPPPRKIYNTRNTSNSHSQYNRYSLEHGYSRYARSGFCFLEPISYHRKQRRLRGKQWDHIHNSRHNRLAIRGYMVNSYMVVTCSTPSRYRYIYDSMSRHDYSGYATYRDSRLLDIV